MPSVMCEHPELQSFLEGKIPPGDEQPWLDHLETCPKCQARIEEMAADRNWWQDARTFLAADSTIDPIASGVSTSIGAESDSEEAGHDPISLDFLAPTDDPESLGRLGGYEVTGIIGRGGSGVVLKAFDRSLNRNVAIKVLSPHLATSGAARKRFAREGQAAAAVVHEHVIPIFAVAAHQNLPYIVMQYFPGRSLQQRLDRDGPLELREILRIGLQTARGLAAAHAQGLIHRDVKPANILLADGIERVTLSDFGLARAVDDARLTRTGWLAGTPEYMSPEQSRGKGLDARSDLFSLGSVLYAASTGRVPFQAETSYGTLRQVTDEDPVPIRQLNADIPDWLCGLIAKLMAKQLENRFGSAEEVANLLETCLAHVQQPETTALPQSLIVKKPQPQARGFRGSRMLAMVFVGLVGFFSGAFALWQVSGPPDIAGWWTGEDWGKVQLKHLGSGEYEGTYSDTFGKVPGTIHLNWSRIERRFSGTWREGEERFGDLSIRLVKDEIRGALTTDPKSKINPATPRLADLLWVKEGKEIGKGERTTAKTEEETSEMRRKARQKEVAVGLANEKEAIEYDQALKLQQAIGGTWIPSVHIDGLFKDREYQSEFPPPNWIFGTGKIIFRTEPRIEASVEILEPKNPALLQLIYPDKSKQYFRVEWQKDRLLVSSSIKNPPEKALPAPGCEYWELHRAFGPLLKPDWAIKGTASRRGVGATVAFPPSKDLLFPVQPLPKGPCANLQFAGIIGNQNATFTKPILRDYEEQEWTNEQNGIQTRIAWTYRGRTLVVNGPDEETYHFSVSETVNGVKRQSWSNSVRFVGQPIKVWEGNKLSITIEPSSMPPFPAKLGKEHPVMAAMLEKIAAAPSMAWRSIRQSETHPIVYTGETTIKGARGMAVWKENGENAIASYFDFGRRVKLNMNRKDGSSYDIASIDDALLLDIRFKLFSLSETAAKEDDNEVLKNVLCNKYTFFNGLDKREGGPAAILWISQITNMPVALKLSPEFSKGFATSITWFDPPADSLGSLEVPDVVTAKNRRLFVEAFGETKMSQPDASKPGSTPPGLEESHNTKQTLTSPRKEGILSKLQGRWKPVRVYRGLEKESDEPPRSEYWVEISGNRYEFIEKSGGNRSWMTIELNNDENPFHMDLVHEHVSIHFVGVIEGNKLRLCQGAGSRPAKKAEPTDGLKYVEYERTDRLPDVEAKSSTTITADRGATRWNDPLRYPLMRVLEAYQGEWTVARHIDENLHALDGSKTAKPEEPWIVFGESFTVAGMPADSIQATFTVPGKPMKIDLMFRSPSGNSDGTSTQKAVRIPSIWSLEGERLRVILGQEGKEPEKLEPAQGFKYFELIRAERKPKPPIPPVAAGNSKTSKEMPVLPKGSGPSLVIVQTAPGVAGRTLEPMGQDERQMVRIVGNGANQTEIRWAYHGKLSFEPDFEVPIYEFQWKYLGTHPPALQKEGSKMVYFQGLPLKIAEFSAIQFAVEAAQNDPRMAAGGKANSSFEGMIDRLSQAKSCILDHRIFEKTDKTSVSNVYWIKNQSIRFCNDSGFKKTIKDDRVLNKRLILVSSKKLAKEQIWPVDQKLYSGEVKSYCDNYKNRKSRFLYSTIMDGKRCDVYQVLPKENDKDSAAAQPLFWIEQGTNLPLRLREPGFLGKYHDVQFQMDIPIDESAFSAEIPPGYLLDKKGEIDRLERAYWDWYQRGLKIGVPLPDFKKIPAEKEARASQIQGTWTVTKKINEDFRDERIVDSKKQTWTIKGDILTSSGDADQKARMSIVDIWPIFQVDLAPQSTSLDGLGFPLKAGGRIPSLWSLEGGKLRVAIGKEGQPPWKLEPALGIQYFELARKADEPPSEAEETNFKLQNPNLPNGAGPNLVIVYSVPGDTWKTVEPMGQDSRQMVRVVGNEANHTEIRWAYQGTISLADGSKIPVYEFQWKYFGTATNFKKSAMLKRVYVQGKQVDLGEYLGLKFHVEPAGKDPRYVEGAKANSSFDAAMDQVAQAKSYILEDETFTGAEKIASTRIYWSGNKYAMFDNRRGLETISKGDGISDQQIYIIPSMKLAREIKGQDESKHYERRIKDILKWFKGQPAEFLHSEAVDGKKCDVYQVYPNIEEIAKTGSPSLLCIEQGTNRFISLREDTPFGDFRSQTFQIDVAIDESLLAVKIPADYAVDGKGEISRQLTMIHENEKRGIKSGQPVTKAGQLPLEIKKKAGQLEGTWIPIKIIGEDFRNVKIVDWEKSLWTIRQGTLITGGDAKSAQRMEILEPWPIFQVEFVRDFLTPNHLVFPSKTGVRIPSLWSLDGDRLRVAIGEEGQAPRKLEPAAGVRYFELIRLSESNAKEIAGAAGLDLKGTESLKAWIGALASEATNEFGGENPLGELAKGSPIPRDHFSLSQFHEEPVKKRILAALEGEWVTTKHVEQNDNGTDESGKPGVVWTIRGESFASTMTPDTPLKLRVVSTGGPTRIDFHTEVTLPRSDGSPTLRSIRVPSLWTLAGNRLKVAIGKEGQKLDHLQPAPGVKYFELVRKSPSPGHEASSQEKLSHWLIQWAEEKARGLEPGAGAANLPAKSPTPSQSDQGVPIETKKAPDVVAQSKKEETFRQISGNWVVTKQSRWHRIDGEIVEQTGDVWEIDANKLKTWGRSDLQVDLEVIATEPHLQIDWVYPGPNRLLRGPFNPEGGRIPSLWAIEKGRLKVLILEDGRYPEKLAPSLGCIYFELAPKEPVTSSAGFPAEFQGRWKLSKTIGIDLKEEFFNRDAIVTIASHRLQIGKEVKKAELVQSGSPLRMNLVAAMPVAAEEVRVPSLWELKGDRLCFNSGKELPAKVGPSPGVYYFELTRIVEPKNSNPGDRGNSSKAGTASQGQIDTGPAANAAKEASFQKMVERLKNAQSASFEMTYANRSGLPQFSATASYLIRGKQVRVDQMIEGTVLVTRIVDSALKRCMFINHNNKTAKIIDFSKSGENIRRTPMDINFLRVFLEGFSPDKDGPQGKRSEGKIFTLRTENLEGKACDVYRVFPSQADDENKGGPWMVWVDSQSHDLVSIRATTFTLSHFQWNLPLDDSPFKLDVPQGFQVTDNWIDAWAAKLEALRPAAPRKPVPPQKRGANQTVAPADAVSKQPAPQLHPMH